MRVWVGFNKNVCLIIHIHSIKIGMKTSDDTQMLSEIKNLFLKKLNINFYFKIMIIKKWFKSKPYWLKGALFALCIWLTLFGLLQISDALFECKCGSGQYDNGHCLPGDSCYSIPENIILVIFALLGLPIILPIGGSPLLSTVGPIGVQKFFIGSAVGFVFWGILIAWIVRKIKNRKRIDI